jgi:hypothetical protein
MYFNYKLFFSIVLQAVADANYRFLFVDVGAYGKQSDGGIFSASSLSHYIADQSNFPSDALIPGIPMKVPYLFVADDAYPLQCRIMKPYSQANLSSEQQIFNGRLSRARRCVECAFGILVNKWRLLVKAIETSENKAGNIVKCATVLHNCVIDLEGIDHNLLDKVNRKVSTLEMIDFRSGRRYNHSPARAAAIRKHLTHYFNSSHGSVPWQERYIK